MSLALDLALFSTNSKTKLGLSLSARGIVFTLTFESVQIQTPGFQQKFCLQECGC